MTKLLIFIPLFFASNFCISQTELSQRQLRKVIKDSANYFQNFKSAFSNMLIADSVFLSNSSIVGTKKNLIIRRYYGKDTLIYSRYSAILIDSVNDKIGKKYIDQWKDIVVNILGDNFELSKRYHKKSDHGLYGWTFRKGQLWVDINLFRDGNNPTECIGFLNLYFFSPGWSRHINEGFFHKVK